MSRLANKFHYNAKDLFDNNELLPYKNKIMTILTSSEVLYELVLNKPCMDIEYAEDLVGVNYVPELFVDETITETQAYILFDIDEHSIQRINTGKSTYNSYKLYFHIICHKNKNFYMVNGIGTRCDCIVAELCRLFKDKLLYSDGGLGIGTNKKIYDTVTTAPNAKYTARELCFLINDFDERVKTKR